MVASLSRREELKPVCYASRGDDGRGNVEIEEDDIQQPCGGSSTNATSCCINGHECTQDGICHFRDQTDKGSGYYIGGCTDKSFNDPACSRACINFNQHDVVYNATSSLWSCCWNGEKQQIDCTNPTSQTFQAVARDSLSDAPSYIPPSATSSPSSASSSSTISSASSPLVTSPSAAPPSVTTMPPLSSGGLSSGAKAGIGVGCAIAGLIILAALAFLILKRWRRRRDQKQVDGYIGGKAQEKDHTASPIISEELDSGERQPELDGIPRSELGACTRLGR